MRSKLIRLPSTFAPMTRSMAKIEGGRSQADPKGKIIAIEDQPKFFIFHLIYLIYFSKTFIQEISMQINFILTLCWLLACVGTQVAIYYDNTTVSIHLATTLPLSTLDPSIDRCSRLLLRTTALYHLSTEGVLQDWVIGSAANNSYSFLSDSSHSTTDFTVNSGETSLTAIDTIANQKTILLLGANKTLNLFGSNSLVGSPSQIFILNSATYFFYQVYNGTHDAVSISGVIHQLSTINGRVFPSPDQALVAVCQPDSQVYLFSSSAFTLLHTFTPTVAVSGVTQQISFDYSSSLMVIETDTFNPVLVVSCSTFSSIYSFSYSDVILSVVFSESNSNFLTVSGSSGSHLYDTRSSILHDISAQLAGSSIFVQAYNNSVFFCLNNQINQYTFSSEPLIINNTSGSSSSNSTSGSSSSNSSSGLNNEDATFFVDLEMSSRQNSAGESLNNGIGFIMDVVKGAALLLSSSPFVVYFLGFFNYITLCSLYVLLNFPMPKHLYTSLKPMFFDLNDTIFTFIGLKVSPELSHSELVNRTRPLFFQISSDFLASNSSEVIIMLMNFLVLLIFQLILLEVRRHSLVRQFFNFNKWDMAFGQVINLMIPSVLPWTFILTQSGTTHFSDKLNFLLFCLFFLVSLAFSIYYLFSLVDLQKKQSLEEQKFTTCEKTMKLSSVKLPRITDKSKALNSKKKVTFGALLTVHVLGEWLICFANFLYPLLILIENPTCFLILIMVFTSINSLIILKDISKNKNYFVLSLYPLVFHSCFIVFYYSESTPTLIYAEIVCLLCLLLGLVHFSLTFCLKMLCFMAKIIKKMCSKSKVSPKIPRSTVSLKPKRSTQERMVFVVKKIQNKQKQKATKQNKQKKMEKECKTPKLKKKDAALQGNIEKIITIKKEKRGNFILNVKFS